MNALGRWFKGDRVIWVVYFFLCIISLIEVFSAASNLSYKSGDYWSPLLKQAMFLGGGTVIVIVVHQVPCRMFKALPIVAVPVSFVLLLITLITGISRNNASRWFDFGFIQFQPSELAKGSVVLAVALILSRLQGEKAASRHAFRLILIVTVPICLLIFSENLSTAVLLMFVVFLMMFVGRVPLQQLGKLLGVGAILIMLAVSAVVFLPKVIDSNSVSFLPRLETWSNRIENFISPVDEDVKNDPAKFDIQNEKQRAHANIAIATGGAFGVLPGNSVQRDFLSQAFSDFIFAIIIEEMGLAGGLFVMFLYIVLLFRAGRIASRCERSFPALLIMGLTLLIVTQAFINMAVAVGGPITGQPLPLISRGGTSTLINCVYIGMILSVSRYARQASTPQGSFFDGSMDDIIHEDDKGAADYMPPVKTE